MLEIHESHLGGSDYATLLTISQLFSCLFLDCRGFHKILCGEAEPGWHQPCSLLPLSLPPSGISTFASHPEKAFDSLRPLLDYAALHIPSSKHSETSLYILCTAGMRLLPSEEQERITSLLHRAISATYPFHLPQDGIEVIPGKLEGRNTHLLWGWIMQGCQNQSGLFGHGLTTFLVNFRVLFFFLKKLIMKFGVHAAYMYLLQHLHIITVENQGEGL